MSGRVQGVGFRRYVARWARRLALAGWVRNEPDGTVCLEAQGEEAAVRAYLADLRRRVSGLVEREFAVEARVVPGEHGFTIAV